MTDPSYLAIRNDKVTAYVGPDATKLASALILRSSLQLYAKAKILPTRGVTITKMLALATGFTGKPYKRGGATRAADDLTAWIEAMRAALPHIQN